MLRLFVGNLSPSLQDTVRVNGAAFDLTGDSVKLMMRDRRTATTKIDAAAQIVVAAAGTVRYDWLAADVDTPGHYVAWWRITLASGKVQDSDEFALYFSGHAPGDPRDLCTIDDVKQAMEPASTTRNRDPLIQTLITSASLTLIDRLEREFTPRTPAASRRFDVDVETNRRKGILVDLSPFDLRVATTVKLHPETAAPTVLAASDYSLEPFGAPRGSYTQIRLSRFLVLVSDFALKFGYAQLEITGDWGLWDTLTVPDNVRDACVLTVRAWLRQSPGQQQEALLNAQINTGVQPAIPVTWDVPYAAMRRLSTWRRWTA